jgi:hypothetical protein
MDAEKRSSLAAPVIPRFRLDFTDIKERSIFKFPAVLQMQCTLRISRANNPQQLSVRSAQHKNTSLLKIMSSTDPPKPSKQRKWDQPAPGEDATASKKTDESRTASEAAAAAAAIAAKIAAQFASGALGSGDKEHDAEFTHDIDINDVRNRYLLTKGSTQEQVCKM